MNLSGPLCTVTFGTNSPMALQAEVEQPGFFPMTRVEGWGMCLLGFTDI